MTIFKKDGILPLETVNLLGHKIYLLHDIKPNDKGHVFVNYNYFEDDF